MQTITLSLGSVSWPSWCRSTAASGPISATTDDITARTRWLATNRPMRSRLIGRHRVNAARRWLITTSASLSSASWIAASTALSPPPTTSTRRPSYWRGSARPKVTFWACSPGSPSRRGVPRTPRAITTTAAWCGPWLVSTTNPPRAPCTPPTRTPSVMSRWWARTMRLNDAMSSSLVISSAPNGP